jgi:hypothetical protein
MPPIVIDAGSFNMRMLWRLCAWGSTATAALVAVVLTLQTQSGAERLQLAFSRTPSGSQQTLVVDNNPPINRDVEIRRLAQDVETRRLADAVRTLTADRDRLAARVATLEQNIGDMTGSIKVQPAQPQTAAQTPADTSKQQTAASNAMASVPATITVRTEPVQHAQQAALPVEQIPLPPIRTANAATTTAETTASIPARPEIGIELGGAPSLDALRAHWAWIKANQGPALVGLQPSTTSNQTRTGATNYKLFAGPLPNMAAAAQLCSRLANARLTCRPTTYQGQKLATQ